MFTFDCYTQTGINAAIKLNDQWRSYLGYTRATTLRLGTVQLTQRRWDNGTRKGQLMFAMDALMRF